MIAAAAVVVVVGVVVVPVTWFAVVAAVCGDAVAVVVSVHCPLQHYRRSRVSRVSSEIRYVFSTTTTFADC